MLCPRADAAHVGLAINSIGFWGQEVGICGGLIGSFVGGGTLYPRLSSTAPRLAPGDSGNVAGTYVWLLFTSDTDGSSATVVARGTLVVGE